LKPELFQIGPLTVHAYGFFLALAFIVGMLVSYRYLRRQFMDAYIVFELVLAAAIGGIVGARIFYVVGHWREFSSAWWRCSSSGTSRAWSSTADLSSGFSRPSP